MEDDDLGKKKGKRPNGSKREESEESAEIFLEVRTDHLTDHPLTPPSYF